VKLMAHFHSETNTGVLNSFLVMGTIYLVFMTFGAFLVRLPAPGWKPDGWTPKAKTSALISARDVSVTDALRTPQFWLLWLVICMNATAGFGILEQASPMIQDLFGIEVVAAGGFVGVLSLFNMGGRFLWSAASDHLGRRTTFLCFFVLGVGLYWFLPRTGANHLNSIFAFVLVSGILISMYGGGFSTIPAYLKDIFGSAQVGPIYGRLQTATTTAGILGPILVNYSRQQQLAAGVSKADAYQFVLHVMAGLLLVGLIANFLVRPVASKFWIAAEGAPARELAGVSQ
jgi:hypothetical protein